MMMIFQKINPMRLFYGVPVFVFVIAGIIACDKEMSPDRFTLTGFNGVLNLAHADTSVTFSWNPALLAWEGDREPPEVTYEIMIAKDAEFTDPDAINVVQDSTTFTIGKERLIPYQEYYARVRIVGGPTLAGTAWMNYIGADNSRTFHVLPEINYFRPIKVGEVIDVAAKLRWATDKEQVTHLVLMSDDHTSSERIALTAEQRASGTVLVEDLAPGQGYQAELYLDNQRRGRISFRTKPDVTGAGYIDLRTSSDPLELQKTLNTVPAGSSIVLKRGMTYTITETFQLDRNVTIMSAPGFGRRAHIQMSSSFDAVEGSQIDLFKFEDVEITGDMGSTYVFNLSPASIIKRIEFEACLISDHRGVVRLKDAGTKSVADYVINNSIVQNIGSYGLLNVDHANTTVNNIHLTNSTFIHSEWIVRYGNSVRNDLASMTIESSTFFQAPHNNRAFIDMQRTGSTIGSFTVRNTLFGYTGGSRTFNRTIPTSINVTNSFATSDANWDRGLIDGVVRYSGSSEQVFAAPNKADFADSDLTIIDETMSTVGDPRWRP